jgi:hypothetical protein
MYTLNNISAYKPFQEGDLWSEPVTMTHNMWQGAALLKIKRVLLHSGFLHLYVCSGSVHWPIVPCNVTCRQQLSSCSPLILLFHKLKKHSCISASADIKIINSQTYVSELWLCFAF